MPTTPSLEPYQLRVIQERDELKVKLDALVKFMKTEQYMKLEFLERIDLADQHVAMDTYYITLLRRTERF